MSNPWENETWVRNWFGNGVEVPGGRDIFSCHWQAEYNVDEKDCALICEAPEMLRMLLELEYSGGGAFKRACIVCQTPERIGHSEHCRLGALLKRLGVR